MPEIETFYRVPFGGFYRIPSSSPLMNRRMLRTIRCAIGHRNPDRTLARCHCPPGHARNLPESQCVKCIAPNRSLKLESVAPCLSPASRPDCAALCLCNCPVAVDRGHYARSPLVAARTRGKHLPKHLASNNTLAFVFVFNVLLMFVFVCVHVHSR